MFNLLVLLCLAAPEQLPMPTPVEEPAYFKIDVEARTNYVVYVADHKITAGQRYKTEPLTELICVEIKVRYVDEGEVVSKSFYMDLEPGASRHVVIKITATPLSVWCQLYQPRHEEFTLEADKRCRPA